MESIKVVPGTQGLQATGVPSKEELCECPGRPSVEGMKEKGRVAVIECMQEIPCDPCVAACPSGAISKGNLTVLPRLDLEKCTGCGLCVAACPGQAIFIIDVGAGEVSVPSEFLPLPKKGEMVECLGYDGHVVQVGEVVKVVQAKRNDGTAVVTVRVDSAACDQVRAVRVRR